VGNHSAGARRAFLKEEKHRKEKKKKKKAQAGAFAPA
jgi:hypothetical protein